MMRRVKFGSVLRRQILGLAGLGARLGLGSAAQRANAAQTDTLMLGESNTPLAANAGLETRLTGVSSPTLELTREPVGRALAVEGGPGTSGKERGGSGMSASGGRATGTVTLAGGTGAVGRGGSSQQGQGGPGAFLWGGVGTGAISGIGLRSFGAVGIVAQGGRSKAQPEVLEAAGAGIQAFGGLSTAPNKDMDFNAGVRAVGGDSLADTFAAGVGIVAEGVSPSKGLPTTPGAHGVGESSHDGVYGESYDWSVSTIVGRSKSAAAGVLGEAFGEGAGVRGINPRDIGARFYAESGKAVEAFGGTIGIQATGESGSALRATSVSGNAVVGRSTGLAGVRASGGLGGGYFETKSASVPAVIAQNLNAGTVPGVMGVYVDGDSQVTAGVKPAAARTSRGLTLLYMVEASSALFEDIGKVRLQGGRARVEIDPLFAETIETDDVQVHLTPRGDTRGVYVAARDARGFEIRERAGGASNVEVNYRIVARRKGFRPERRLATFKPPAPPARTDTPRPPRPQFRQVAVTRPDLTRLRRGLPGRQGGAR